MTYLLRLNLDIKEKNFKDNLRFKRAVSTIKAIQRGDHKVVIVSHRGRPASPPASPNRGESQGGPKGQDRGLSLRPFAIALSRALNPGAMTRHSTARGFKIIFLPNFNFPKIKERITDSPSRSIFLLENIRFLSGESKNSQTLAKKLSSLADRYLNDDFATSHREATSVSAITRFLPSQAGPTLKTEIKKLEAVKSHPQHPFVVIIGGAKTEDKLGMIKNILPKADWILLGGRPANTFLKGRGFDIKKSLYAPNLLKMLKPIINHKKIVTPIDWLTEGGKILDIGPETRAFYAEIISEAATIIWNGPMGIFEKKKFSHGTEAVARAIFKNKRAATVIGGGDTINALSPAPNKQELGNIFISTGGGAMLEFLAGKKLPAIEALRKRHGL